MAQPLDAAPTAIAPASDETARLTAAWGVVGHAWAVGLLERRLTAESRQISELACLAVLAWRLACRRRLIKQIINDLKRHADQLPRGAKAVRRDPASAASESAHGASRTEQAARFGPVNVVEGGFAGHVLLGLREAINDVHAAR